MKMLRRTPYTLFAAGAVAFALAACSTSPTPDTAPDPAASGDTVDAALVESLGGQEVYDQLMSLYDEAVEAGQTKVTIYGPEAASMTPVLLETWSQIFPEITLEGVQLAGPPLAERMTAEATTGQGVGDVVISGSSFVPGHEKELVELETFAGAEIGDEWRGPKGVVTTALMPFAFAYNPATVKESELPTEWSDVLKPAWQGRVSTPDPTTGSGVMVTAITSLLDGGAWTKDDVFALAKQEFTLVPPTNASGSLTNVAQGQSDGAFFLSTTRVREAMDDGAPIKFAFPMESDNVLIREYLGILASGPSPLAAELYANWRLTKSGADALAGYGFYSLVEGAESPSDMPKLEDVDIFDEVLFTDLPAAYDVSKPLIAEAFGVKK